MRVLIVDNRSAHLENLKALIVEKLGEVEFALHDPREVESIHLVAVDLVVISGGWGRSIAKNPLTFKRLINLLSANNKPVIGICLGAEAIAAAFGAKLAEMPIRRVGNIKISLGSSLEEELGTGSITAYEFHKWLIDEIVDPLEILATSKDGIEVLRHKTLPMWGLQFHPEVRRLENKGHQVFEHALKQLGFSIKTLML